MAELYPYLVGKKTGKVVGITFDDGYHNNLAVLPILQRYRFTATNFIVSDYIGDYNRWDIPKNIPKNRLMSQDDIKQWLDAGMSIGAHTKTHVNLNDCTKDVAWQQIYDCQETLTQLFGVKIDDFCYPYGQFAQQHIDYLKQLNFRTATAMYRGKADVDTLQQADSYQQDRLLSLPRVTINNNCYAHIFLLKLLSNYENNKGKSKRKSEQALLDAYKAH